MSYDPIVARVEQQRRALQGDPRTQLLIWLSSHRAGGTVDHIARDLRLPASVVSVELVAMSVCSRERGSHPITTQRGPYWYWWTYAPAPHAIREDVA